jgi:L-threonylcarbamoyladenylate synthase
LIDLIQIDPESRGTDRYIRLLERWRQVLSGGGVAAFATDTVWGIGALARSAEAVERIYELKGRQDCQPLACLVAGVRIARRWAACWPSPVDRLARLHWPGPLTLILPTAGIPLPAVQRGVSRLGLRVPARPVLLDLLELLAEPLAATSANRSGQPELSGAEQIGAILGDGLDLLVSDNLSVSGVASTVVEWNESGLKVLRQGSLTVDLEDRSDERVGTGEKESPDSG